MSPLPAAIAAEQAVLEEIIVTATRRQTDLQSTPISVASFSGDALKELGVDDLRDVSQFVAGVYVGESAGAGSSPITIRGVGDNQLGLGAIRRLPSTSTGSIWAAPTPTCSTC